MSEKKDSGRIIQEKAGVLWNVANTISGLYKPHEYGLVILPMVVIKRFHDCLVPTQAKVLKKLAEVKNLAMKDAFLREESGYQFYNTSKFTFETLCADPKNIGSNFRDYLNGFSENVKDILEQMEFDKEVAKLEKNGALYQVVTDFNTPRAYLGPDAVATNDMGYIFENLVQRFSESYDEHAGAHFTSRDIIYLMCDLLLAFFGGNKKALLQMVYDMTMGTSQMLTCMEDRLKEIHPEMEVANFGQEINPFTYAIAKADMLIRGGDPDNMRFGNTLSDDKFKDFLFDFIISNPPFGIDWKKEAREVEREAEDGEGGRFAPGLPPKSDGQMLFLLNGVKKLKETGRMAIIQNGSSLFTGDAGSGPSEIRRYLIENDWLEAIVQLPNDSFYNTGIATYVWIISKAKPANRAGKVQLIDASACCVPRRRPIGKKRVDITSRARELVVAAYKAFANKDYEVSDEAGNVLIVKSRVFDSTDFGYTKITVETPVHTNGAVVMKRGIAVPDVDKRDTENVPLQEDVTAYLNREVKQYNPDAYIDLARNKIGYEIPFTRVFYRYKPIAATDCLCKELASAKGRVSAAANKLNFPCEGQVEKSIADWLRTNRIPIGSLTERIGVLKKAYTDVVNILEKLKFALVFETATGNNAFLFGKNSKVSLTDDDNWFVCCRHEWKVMRIGALYSLRNEKVSDKDFEPLSVTMKGIVPQLKGVAKTEDGDNRKLVRVGDFVINSRSDRRGACGISRYDGSVSLINLVLTPRQGVSLEYYDFLFNTARFADEFYRWGHGIVDDLWTTRWSEMKRILVPFPPLEVQQKIAKYLQARIAILEAEMAHCRERIAYCNAISDAAQFLEDTGMSSLS